MAKTGESEKEIVVDEKNIVTILADDIVFKGSLQFKTSLMIKGTFEGDIDSTGELVIGEKAVVKAKVKSATIVCYGRIDGNVEATKSIIFARTAVINGDIKTPDLVIQSGCKFNGNCAMVGGSAPAAASAAPASGQQQNAPAGLPPKR
ncbi:MAG: polymer-forming cytoskeletal protein [Spirochaetes bacterium]|nr:polymer-forming cytoskeletal protein [Spirochaetota bacterium]